MDAEFRTYHEVRKNIPQDFRTLKGIEFENYVAQRLRDAGYSVAGTPATGDQGADLIAKKDGITIAIQAKGYAAPVGNGAVQEIVGALRFYHADEGWVATNSTFTKSARSLAHANNIRLIEGSDLKDFFSAHAAKTADPASAGPAVIFHDIGKK
jgi:HJR/Mrr/RecB family endonuclease